MYDEDPVDTYVTQDGETSHSFLDKILEDSATKQYGYSATIQVLPQYGEGEKQNYEESDPSEKIAPRYTAKITLVSGNGVENCYIIDSEDADDTTTQSIVLLQGQSVDMRMTSKTGYMASDWTINTEANAFASIQDSLSRATLKLLTTGMSKPEEIVVTAVAADEYPTIYSVNATMAQDHTKVAVAMEFHDTIGLASYALVRRETPLGDDDILTVSSTNWKSIPKDADKAPTSYSISEDITEYGYYYVCVKDTAGNVRYRSTPITVYKIIFDKGVEEALAGTVTGEMPAILKLKDEPVELPSNNFVRAGYGFTNWVGGTGIYAVDGTYVVNANDTLVAGWTDAKVSYKVRYFYQQLTETTDEGGNRSVSVAYVEDPDLVASFTVAYGTEIAYNKAEIQMGKTGYTLTNMPEEIADYAENYRITEDNQEICLYYNLEKYRITYTYTDTAAQPQIETQEYYYGQTVTELEKPKAVGYSFVGWNWGDAGQAPATMPNNNLKVTGSFKAEQVKYYIVYYMQDLDQSVGNASNNYLAKTFSKDDTLTEEINASYGENLLADIEEPMVVPAGTTSVVARSFTGFTPVAVQISYGNPVTTEGDEAFDTLIDGNHTSESGTVQKKLTGEELTEAGSGYQNGPTYICFYYTRNIHTLTMDVYKDARENNVHLFGSYFDGTGGRENDNASWILPYGYQFAPEDGELTGDGSDGSYKATYFETFGYEPMEDGGTHSKNWTKRWPTGEGVTSKDKYYLADFVDWSCGERPTTMPDGDVSITREYASKELAKYNIEVYIETLSDVTKSVTLDDGTTKDVTLKQATGTYEKKMTYERYAQAGQKVKIVDTMPAEEEQEEDCIYISVDDLAKGVTNYKLYEHNPLNDLCNGDGDPNHELLEAVITENIIENNVYTNVTTLRLNLVRKEHTAVVRYHELTSSGDEIFAYRTITQKWGTGYLVDPLYYFDGKSDANENGTIINGTTAQTDFRTGNYVVSYTSYYWLPSSGHSPSKQYVNYTELNEAPALVLTIGTYPDGTEPSNVDMNNSRSYTNVYYSAQETDKHYYLKLTYEEKNTGQPKAMMVSETEYPALAAVTDDKTQYQVCVANKCDVFETNGTTIGTGEERYPGSQYLSANSETGFQYTYALDAEGKEKLRAGFVPVSLHYRAYENVNENAGNPGGTLVEGDATFYLYVVDGISDGNLYAIDERNQFYNGNRLSFSYNSLPLYAYAHVGRDYFMAEGNRPTSGRVVERANSTAALYNDGETLTGNITDLTTHNFLAYYYDVYNDYYITFHYDGQSCSGSPHDNYSYNEEITEFICNTFTAPEGYHIAWYMDADYTTPVHAFNITGPTNIYGRREKNPVENWDYVYYKLPKAYQEAEWITLENVNSFTWTDRTCYSGEQLTPETVDNSASIEGSGCETITKSVNVDYINEMGNTTTIAGLRTEWYIDGQLVMAKQPNYSMTFIEFYMNPSLYEREGFVYDETNVKNKSKAFCTTTPVNMYAYFTRTSHTLTVSRRNSKIDNDEVSTRVYGVLITLEDPVKKGYEFNGWKLQQVTANGENTTYTDLDAGKYSYVHVDAEGATPGYATFTMPPCDTIAIAQWTPVAVEYEIIHYLQDDNKTYKPELLETVRGMTGTPVTVKINSNEVLATLYQNEADVKGISYTEGDRTYYYAGMDTPEVGTEYEIETTDAFAVVQKVADCKSEDTPAVSSYELTDLGSIFSLSFAKYEYDTEQRTLSTSDTFTVYHDINLSYYYERSSSIRIRGVALSSDAGDTGLTLSGAGNRYYGEKFNLYAVMQPSGYTFLGWFDAKDVLKDYPTDGSTPESLSGMVLKEGVIAGIQSGMIHAVSTELTFPIVAKKSEDYVAITAVSDVTKPAVTVKSARILTQEEADATNAGKPSEQWVEANPYYYQYENDASNVLTATVNWGESGSAGSSVKGYKWYFKYYAPGEQVPEESSILTSDMEEIPNSNSGTYLFPTGKDAGIYVYRCVVDVERKDNGRTGIAEGTYRLEVHPCETYYNTYSGNVKYDGAAHTYTDYFRYSTGSNIGIKGYYSKTEIPVDISAVELEERLGLADENEAKIYTSKVTFTDVNVTEDETHTVIPNVAYYYIQSTDPNYASIVGSEDVTIQPVEVSVAAKKPFTKIYDGTKTVLGSYNSRKADTTFSDFHRLLTGSDLGNGQMYYEISGILPCDQDKQLRLNFEAEFDNEHVVGATTVTLSHMWVAQTDVNRVMNNYNYRFPDGAMLQLSGQIKPYSLSVKWIPLQTSDASATYSTEDFKYNYDGTEKHPYVVITEDNPPDPKETIVLKVGNVQKNVGTYDATVEVSTAEEADYKPSDYTFTLTKQSYEILPRYIQVRPKDVTKVYNGSEQTMVKNETVDEFRFFTKEKAEDEWIEYDSLPTGETFSVSSDRTGKNVGTYTVTAKDIVILNNQNKNINDNYDISYGSGNLTIIPCPVIVNGISAEDKNYDKTDAATLSFENVQFSRLKTVYNGTTHDFDILREGENAVSEPGLYASDSLELDTGKVTGKFEDVKAGNDKTVHLTIDNSTANANGSGGALKGVSKDNYRLVTGDSQQTTTASILAGTELTVSVSDCTYVYGEQPAYIDYSLSYTGFMEGDTASGSVSNHATFIIKKMNDNGTYTEVAEDGTSADMKTLPAGEYAIFLKEKEDGTVYGLQSDDYTIKWDKEPATLTVRKRPVRIVAKNDAPEISKEYDNTKDVLSADKTAIKENSSFVYYTFEKTLDTSIQEIAASGIVNGDEVTLGSFTALYNSKDVETADKVNITNAVLDGAKAGNYELCNTSFDLKGKITAKALTIKINDTTTTYGNPAPEYTYTLDGVVESEEDTIADAVKAAMHPVCEYTNEAGNAKRVVGTYVIKADDTDGFINGNCYQNPNYNITFQSGTLTVEKRVVYYKADDQSIIYQKDPLPTYTGNFLADDEDALDDGWVYGENVAGVDRSLLVQLYTDENCLNAVEGNNYTFSFKCWENADKTVEVSSTTPADDYDIEPVNVEGQLFAKNYEFKKACGTLRVNKYYLRVYNVEVLGKIYDGTTTVDANHLLTANGRYGNYDYEGIKFTFYKRDGSEEKSFTTMTTEEKESLDISAKYQSAGVGDNKWVNVTIKLKPDSYLDKRYILLTGDTKEEAKEALGRDDISEVTQTLATAFIIGANGERIETAIQPRPLTLYPTDEQIRYGEILTVTDDADKMNTPNYSVVVDRKPAVGASGDAAAIGFVEDEGLSTIGFTLGQSIYATNLTDGRPDSESGTPYTAGSDVGYYAINISTSTPQGVSGNYDVGYEKGLLTVVQNHFPAPTITWDTTDIGTINWTAVAQIGNVDVADYEVSLYRDGTPVNSVTVSSDTLSYDFSSQMHENAGEYTVKVRAIASTTNNESYKNVAKEGEFGTSAGKYAAKVTVQFDETAGSDTAAATTKTKTATITDAVSKPSSYIMIAGEKDIPIAYEWGRLGADAGSTTEYRTGYEIDTCTVSSDDLSLGTATDNSALGKYSNTVFLAENHESASDLTVTLKLKAREATLNADVVETHTPSVTEIMYGYAGDSVVYRMNPQHSDDPATEYIYTYEWSIKRGLTTYSKTAVPSGVDAGSVSWNEQIFRLPEGFPAYYATYKMVCTVTATRKDNGESVTVSPSADLRITKAVLDASAINLTVSDWIYGADRTGKITASKVNTAIGDLTLYYKKNTEADTAWRTALPTDVGTYDVKAVSAANDNCESVTSEIKQFTIAGATLETPSNLTMTASDTAPYGLVKWDEVIGPKENDGATDDSKSSIDVQYEVTLKYKETDASEAVQLGGMVTTGETQYDFTDRITMKGTYYVYVKAVVKPRDNQDFDDQDTTNCADSGVAEYSAFITIGAEISSNGTETTEPVGFTKVYDGSDGLTMTVTYADTSGNVQYQWYKNGNNPIDGATENAYTIYYVEENANYVCKITPDGGNPVYTKSVYAKITPRPVTIKTNSKEKVYDGTPLTDTTWELSYTGNIQGVPVALGLGDTVTCSVTGTATYVADTSAKNNTYENLVVKHGEKVVYQKDGTNNNYALTEDLGTLTIKKRPITITADSTSENEWVYDGATHSKNSYTCTAYGENPAQGLAGGDVIASVIITGEIQDAGEVANIPSNCVIRKGDIQTGENVTANYAINYVNGLLKVTQKQASITLSGNMNKTYDGGLVSDPQQRPASSEGAESAQGAFYEKTGDGTVSFMYYTKDANGNYVERTGGAPKDAGTYYVKAFTAETTNYKAASSDYLQFTIGKREVTLTADNANSVYGQPLATFGYTQSPSNQILEDDLAGLNIQLRTTATSTAPAGIYPITIDYTENANYDIDTQNGTYTITNAQLSVQAADVTKEYDGQSYGIAVDVQANAVAGDANNIKIYYSTTELTADNYQRDGSTNELKYAYVNRNGTTVSDYTVYYYVTCDSYDGVAGSAKVLITPKALTIVAGSASAEYNPNQPLTNNTYTIEGGTSLVPGDKITDITITGSQDIIGSSRNVASNAVIHNQNGAGDDVTGCYAITYQPGTLAVGLALQEITAQDLTIEYDGAIHNMSEILATTTGDSTLVYTATKDGVAAQEIRDPGILFITITAPGNDRYAEAQKHVKLTITPREITIAADSDHKVYDGTVLTKQAYVFKEGSLAQTDEMTVTYKAGGAITQVGEVDNEIDTITIMRDGVDVTESCYDIDVEKGELSVEKRSIMIRAKDKTKVYDGTPLTCEEQPLAEDMYDLSEGSLAPGETITSLDFAGSIVEAGSIDNVVRQAVIVNGLNEDVTSNYNITYVNGKLTITRLDARIQLSGKMDKTYDGKAVMDPVPADTNPLEDVASYTRTGDGEVSVKYYKKTGNDYTELEAGAPVVAGTYYVKAFTGETLQYNAAESAYMEFTIAKRALEITAAGEHKVYDGKELTFVGRDFAPALYSVTAGSLVQGDTIKGMTFAGSITNAGSAKNEILDTLIENAEGENVSASYDISYVAGELTVEAALEEEPAEEENPTEEEETQEENEETTSENTTAESTEGFESGDSDVPARNENIVPGDHGGILIVSTDTSDRDQDNHIDSRKCFRVFLSDKEGVARSVLSDEEWGLYQRGGRIEIRLMIRRLPDVDESENLVAFLDEFIENSDAVLRSYIDLALEKKVLESDWERIFETRNEIPVTILIPEELRNAGEELYLIRQEPDGYSLMQDMDTDPDTITIFTENFEDGYALIAVVDEKIAADAGKDADVDTTPVEDHESCFWHWIILLMLLLSVAITLFYWKTEDEDNDEVDDGEVVDDDDEDDDSDKPRKIRRKGYGIFVVGFNGIGIICVILGCCKWDLPLAVISILLSAVVDTTKNQEKRTDKKEK
ncbi:MAG: MBG domain-containing protein [Lachnospiraceae bacterium]